MKNFQNKAKIIKVSGQLRVVACVALITWLLGLLLLLGILVVALTHGGNARAVYLDIGGILEMVFALMVSLNFFRFFDRLKNGELFDAKTVGYFIIAGQWWFGYSVLNLTFAAVGNTWFETKLDFNFGSLLASVVVIFVAWLLREAQELQAEHELTV